MREVSEEIKKLDKIQETEMLTGPYDIMAVARADKLMDITNTLIEEIRSIDKVEETTTNIFIEYE
ncbi:hypothetical protein AKJ64_04940 [candidate division MSBL1 archaeon SCGC-AAA259E17]|uniref:Transcription regulator AsnC/Lrp ligand binding domain-containing protein n=1 Tax=candidate division MSBL1 archaeon SCGC-AAA259E17 TaxID=1698263 RepID=A0A133UAB3_9EURY|nr:hypothetical protein AKJ64_04940 [candidate division MSBL1 archaeon SCGC-AAA259E17]